MVALFRLSLFNSVNNGGIKAREAAEDDLIKP